MTDDRMMKMSTPDRIATSLAGILFTTMTLLFCTIPLILMFEGKNTNSLFEWALLLSAFCVCICVLFWCLRYTYRAICGYRKRPPRKQVANQIDDPLTLKEVAFGLLMMPVVIMCGLVVALLAGFAVFGFASLVATAPLWLIFLALWGLDEHNKKS